MIIILIAIFFALLLLGAPLMISMGASSMVWLVCSDHIPNLVMIQKIFSSMDNFSLMAVPFFMIAGQVMERAGITENIVKFSNSCVGWIRGGIAHTTEFSGIIMAGISGSSAADGAALSSMLLRGLQKAGYDPGWAVAIVSSAASIGPIIPPSIIMIVYANAAGLNIGKLFLGGIIPGLMLGIGYMIICYFYAKKHNIPVNPFCGFKQLFKDFSQAFGALLMPIIIIGGILLGVFTATEAGVIGVIYGLIYGLFTRRLTLKAVVLSIRDAAIAAVGPLSLIAFSSIMGYALAREGVTEIIANFCSTYIHSQFGFLCFIVLICVIAGCFIDGTAAMLILTPVVLPIVVQMGIDVQQFSVIFMIAIMSAGLTPPVGGLLFIVSAADNIPLNKCVKPVIPFVIVTVLVMVIMMFIPGTATWIPSLAGY